MFWGFLLFFFSFFPKPSFAANPTDTKFGIFYTLWHKLGAKVYDISKIQAGNGNWGNIPAFHWWGEPQLGYYDLSTQTDVLVQHANQLSDASIDFIFIDMTNWTKDESAQGSGDTYKAIQAPLLKLLQTWSQIPHAPKIVPWIRLPDGKSSPLLEWYLKVMDNDYPQMRFIYEGKPLILGSYGRFEPDPELFARLSNKYTYRSMWAFGDTGPFWSYLQRCQNDMGEFKKTEGRYDCNQPVTLKNGHPEQISVSVAYQRRYISENATNIPKFDGRTFRRQFDAVLKNPGIPIVTITGWNEWIAQRFCLDAEDKTSANPANCHTEEFPDSSKIFVDQYDVTRNRDIEPAKGGKEDYYYELMKSCIALYKSNNNCSQASQNLCCRDFSSDWRNYTIKTTPSPSLKPGDVNGDQKVNLTDYSLWKEQFILGELGTKDLSSSADFNQDKKVNILDYGIWKQEYLESLVN